MRARFDRAALHHRRSIRLRAHDYRQPGAYFVTICTHERTCLLGDVVDGVAHLNEYGAAVSDALAALPRSFGTIRPDAVVVMPNHVHCLLVLAAPVSWERGRPRPPLPPSEALLLDARDGHSAPATGRGNPAGTRSGSVGAVVQNFKAVTARKINQLRGTPGAPVWQRNYYEHVVRDDKDLDRINRYIVENSQRWTEDEHFPDRTATQQTITKTAGRGYG